MRKQRKFGEKTPGVQTPGVFLLVRGESKMKDEKRKRRGKRPPVPRYVPALPGLLGNRHGNDELSGGVACFPLTLFP